MLLNFVGLTEEQRNAISELLPDIGCNICENGYTVEFSHTEEKRLEVSFSNGKGKIIYSLPCTLYRAVGLLAESLSRGEKEINISEELNFDSNGPMFDISQGNSVPNMNTIKSFIRQLALMGLNTLLLYSEDSFEIKSQPYFGYMRSKYTQQELKEIDDYAYKFGIEVIPCIQTLAHLFEPLRWKVYKKITDYNGCLLVGEEETYKFIEDIITESSKPFRTKKIHIGMDEAWNLGRGKYIDKFGYTPSSEIMKKHLSRVMEIVNKAGLEPMMWDDMFFRSYGTKKYYQPENPVPEEIRKSVPENMTVFYWDYDRYTEEEYLADIPRHFELSDKVAFAGSIWSWFGYSLCWSKTLETTKAALSACRKSGIKTVIMTVWGDDGTECLMNVSLIGCQLFAELGYNKEYNEKNFKNRFHFITGGNVDDFALLESLDRTPNNEMYSDASTRNSSRYIMWQDILTGLADKNLEGWELDDYYKTLTSKLEATKERNGQFNGLFEVSYNASKVLSTKSEIGIKLRKAYLDNDRIALKKYADEILQNLKNDVINLRNVHKKNWFELYKPLGWDVLDIRYGGLIMRIQSAVEEINDYLDGKITKLEELEQERLLFDGRENIDSVNRHCKIVSPSRISREI